MTLPEKDVFSKLVDAMTPSKSTGVAGNNQDNEVSKEATSKKKPRQQLPQQQDKQQQPPQQQQDQHQQQQQQVPAKKAPDSSLLSTDMLIVKSPPDEKGAGSAAGESCGGGAWAAVASWGRACWRGPGARATLVVLGALHISLGLLLAAGGALGAARGAAVAAAGAALWAGGAAGAAGAAALWAGLRGRGRGRGAAAHLALSLCALALSNLVAVLAAVGLARDAARARDLPDPKGSDASPLLAGLLAVSALHVLACVWSAARTCRLACPCLRGSGASSRSDGSRGSSWGSDVASGRRRLVSSWLGQQARPPAAAAAPHVVLVAPPLPLSLPQATLGQPILAPLYAVQTPTTKLPPASVINFHIPASLPYMNPMPKHRHAHQRPQSLPYSQSLARPKRKRIPEDQRRHHTLEGRHSKTVPAKTQPKKKRQITEEEVEKTYTGLDRNLAEEFISIAMEPGVGKERLARSSSDGVSSSSQPPASI